MLIKRISLENVRSFLDRQELKIDGPISLIIGPNGGGKTNLLDSIVSILRRHLIASRYLVIQDHGGGRMLWGPQQNNSLNNLSLEKHESARDAPQLIEMEVEASAFDIENMSTIKADAPSLIKDSKREFGTNPWDVCTAWTPEEFLPGDRFTYKWDGARLMADSDPKTTQFRQFLQLYEMDNQLRSDLNRAPLHMPMMYLPVNRAASGFQSMVRLVDYNDLDQKRLFDATSSRNESNLAQMAVGRIARKFRRLQENSNRDAREAFRSDIHMKALSDDLAALGYKWELETIDVDANQYDIRLDKQGTSFLVSSASSGERELLTYLFAIHALNVRDAVIIIDEPELHLHPKWQKSLLDLFQRLAVETGNQFLMATHSPSFITPASIQYVSRVYSEDQQSRVVRLNATELPQTKHLFNAVNSQNNERVFFSDHVILVEGITDRMFFERVLALRTSSDQKRPNRIIEVVSVGGKGMFAAYRKLLQACAVQCSIIADRDYLEQIGTDDVKKLFKVDEKEIKEGVIFDNTSIDGATLVAAIDLAIECGEWGDAIGIWNYIKARRIKVIDYLDGAELEIFRTFIADQRKDNVYVLSKGALESYLPTGFRSKDVEKLIEFISLGDFWERLPADGRTEIDVIISAILDATDNANSQQPPP